MKFHEFVEELHRRHVFKVAGAYLIASFSAVTGSDTILNILQIDQKYSRTLLYIALAGLPVVLVVAWMFDFTKNGIVRTPGRVTAKPDAATPTDSATRSSTRNDEVAYGAVVTARRAAGGGGVLSSRATGMFGLGVLVAIVSLAAYSKSRAPSAPGAANAADSAAALADIRSIAVMPFEDLSEKKDQQYFADGMRDELFSRLAQVGTLQIVDAQGFASAAHGGDPKDIADRLGVKSVLSGTVQKARDSIRVSVKLINATTRELLYSESFTRPTSNVFQMQDEIADAVANSLQVKTTSAVGQATGESGTTNAEASEFYMQGLKSLSARTDDQLRLALNFFTQAIKADSNFAAAYAGLAQTYAVLPTIGSFKFEEAGLKGYAAATHAIGIDPKLAEAHAAAGQIAQNIDWNPAAAEVEYKNAIKFSQGNYATAHQWYAETLTMLGRTDEAMREINLAMSKEPFSPAAKNTLGYVLTVRGDLDSALVVFRNEGALYPEYRLGQLTHALTALTARQYAEAESAARAYAGTDTKLAETFATVIGGASGKVPRATAVRAAASLEARLGPGFTALWFGSLGDDADAMKMVQKAYDARNDANFPYFVIHPLLKPLHANPAYQKIVNEMGIIPAR